MSDMSFLAFEGIADEKRDKKKCNHRNYNPVFDWSMVLKGTKDEMNIRHNVCEN